jgi:hemerythrin-like domain-containing protein
MPSTDAIVLLKNDHKEVKVLFRQFEKLGEGSVARKGQLVARIIELLTTHTYLENTVMYPEVRKLLPDLEDDVLESYEEHHVADVLCFELYEMKPGDEHFTAKATVLIENIEHHIGEEEGDWFPKVRAGLSRSQLQDMGARMLALKAKAPKKPTDPKAVKSAVKAVTA